MADIYNSPNIAGSRRFRSFMNQSAATSGRIPSPSILDSIIQNELDQSYQQSIRNRALAEQQRQFDIGQMNAIDTAAANRQSNLIGTGLSALTTAGMTRALTMKPGQNFFGNLFSGTGTTPGTAAGVPSVAASTTPIADRASSLIGGQGQATSSIRRVTVPYDPNYMAPPPAAGLSASGLGPVEGLGPVTEPSNFLPTSSFPDYSVPIAPSTVPPGGTGIPGSSFASGPEFAPGPPLTGAHTMEVPSTVAGETSLTATGGSDAVVPVVASATALTAAEAAGQAGAEMGTAGMEWLTGGGEAVLADTASGLVGSTTGTVVGTVAPFALNKIAPLFGFNDTATTSLGKNLMLGMGGNKENKMLGDAAVAFAAGTALTGGNPLVGAAAAAIVTVGNFFSEVLGIRL